MPVKIRHIQLKEIQWVDYEQYFHKYMNNDLYETLEIKDLYELYNRMSGTERHQTTLEKEGAFQSLKTHPDIFRIEYSKLNTEPEPLAKGVDDNGSKPIEEKDFPFEFLKILFEAGLNNKKDVTKTLEACYPLEKYEHDNFLNQDGAIEYFLRGLKEDKLIRYDSHISNIASSTPYICRWTACITKEGVKYYLDLEGRLRNQVQKTLAIPAHTKKNRFLVFIRSKIAYDIAIGLFVLIVGTIILKILGVI